MKRILVSIAAAIVVLLTISVSETVWADNPKPPTAPTPVATWPAKPPRTQVVPAGGGDIATPLISTTQVISTNVVEIRGSNLLPSENQYAYVIGYGDDFPWSYTLASSKWDTNVLSWTTSLIRFNYSPCIPFRKGEFYVRIGDWSSAWFAYDVPTAHIEPNNVVVSNVTDKSATISFLTKEETCTSIAYWATDRNRLSDMRTVSNWIAWPTSREHWSRIGWGDIEIHQAYNFNIVINGWVAYTGTFTTTITPPLSMPDPAYGYVYRRGDSAPVKGALVYLTYTVGVTPTVLSTFSASDGSWIINRSSTDASSQQANASNLKVQTGGGSTMELLAINHQGSSLIALPSDYNNWPCYLGLGEIKTVNIRLGVGWNSIALPVDHSDYYRISDLVADSDNAISGVYMYNNGGWTGTVVNNGRLFGYNTSLWSGTGMMVSATKPATITIKGYVPTWNTRYLYPGWNFVSWTVISTTKASNVSDDAGKMPGTNLFYIREVDRRAYGSFEGHISGYTFNNFLIEEDKGYFVFARSRGGLTPGQPYQVN